MDSDKFRHECERLTDDTFAAGRRLGLAVSGGPDSLALLILAAKAFPGAIAAATVDHQLRAEAADEAAHAAAICSDLHVPHAILTPSAPITGNLQSAARRERYALLEEWRAESRLAWVATAHHADDQLETMLMRLLRGSGVDGLAAIRPVNGHVIRPLLGCRKAELEAIVAAEGLAAIRDPSNEDDRFDRTAIRQALGALPDVAPDRIAQSTSAFREASEALAWAAADQAEQRVRETADGLAFDPEGLPREIVRRVVISCLDRIEPGRPPRGPALDELLKTLTEGKTRTMGAVLCRGGAIWQFALAPKRQHG
ncbi:MAG: tRNA lysidine(34) synthetase TilS [Parasphingopyxis sp.]|uniref:tRNA lysidine(34) synthetase TilS n=1 Tax=Parasphingopyxis sp. TaxID=1920299 RepID=UPI0032ED55E9